MEVFVKKGGGSSIPTLGTQPSKVFMLSQYFSPSAEVIEAVQSLEVLFQTRNSGPIATWLSFKETKRGTFTHASYDAMSLLEKFEAVSGKPWEYLYKALKLISLNSLSKVDLDDLEGTTPEIQVEYFKLLQSYLVNKPKLKDWLKDLPDTVEHAIQDALELSFVPWNFTVMGWYSATYKPGPISMCNAIMEVKDLQEYAEMLPSVYQDQSFSFVYARNREYFLNLYCILVYEGTLYCIDNDERRLNLKNTAGMRDPDRHFRNKYHHCVLPFDKMMAPYDNSLPSVNGNFLRSIPISEEDADVQVWAEIFMYRCIDHVRRNKELPQGVTAKGAYLLTSEKEQLVKSSSTINTAVEEAFPNTADNLPVVIPESLPVIVAPREYYRDLVIYEHKKKEAERLQEAVDKDFAEHKAEVLSWISNFLDKQDLQKLLSKGFEDKPYGLSALQEDLPPGSVFGGTDYLNPENFKQNSAAANRISPYILKYEPFMESGRGSWDGIYFHLNPHRISEKGTDRAYTRDGKCQPCSCCNQYKTTTAYRLFFHHFAQMEEFFGPMEDAPWQLKKFLNQQHLRYTGNSILDDTDPVDNVLNKWFRKEVATHFGGSSTYDRHSAKCLVVRVGLCNKCVKKLRVS
jgi:hypothetical protein